MNIIFQTTFFVTLVFIIDLVVAIHVLMNKHEEPASAVLWLFIVFSFPIFGVIIYLFFGINRINTLGVKIEQADKRIKHKNEPAYEQQYTSYKNSTDPLDHNLTIDRLLPESTPLNGNKLQLLVSGTAAYPQMLAAIQQAKHHIHLQSFIIHNDIIGKKIITALAKKAKDGVKVKILYDKFGSLKGVFSLFFIRYNFKNPNFKMIPFALINLFAPWRVQLRNHRKLLIIDGKTAFIGGINISSANDAKICNKDKYIHDLHCMVEGPAVNPMQLSFLRDWHYATRNKKHIVLDKEYFPEPLPCGNTIVRVIDSGPGYRYAATEKIYNTAAATAKESILILTPYFCPDRAFIRALIMAAARGIKVKIVMPKHNNHWYVKFASRSLYRTLLENNIEIYEKSGIFSHAKAMLIDNSWAYMGSSNCDTRSFRLNYELDFVAEGGQFITNLSTQLTKEFTNAKKITLKHKNILIRLLENMCSLLTPVL